MEINVCFFGTIYFALIELNHPSVPPHPSPFFIFACVNLFWMLFSNYMCQFDELVLWRVVLRFMWDSFRGERD